MDFLLNVRINFSCLTSADKSLHLLCAHLLVIANYESEKRTLVVMVSLALEDFFLFCCCSQLKGKKLLQIYISKKKKKRNTSRRQ